MDDHRFDGLTRKLAQGTTRRQALKFLAGGVAGGVAGVFGRRVAVQAQADGSCLDDAECRAAAADTIGPCATGTCEGAIPFLGVRGTCQFAPGNPGAICRPANGPCDRPEFCSGTSTACPVDTFAPSGTMCRPSTGPCDIADFCTGTSPFCTADRIAPAGTVCRAATGPCEAPATCTGFSTTCPANQFLPQSTVCRAAVDPCDVPEFCTGSSALCPADTFAPAGTPCGEDGDICNGQETCDGAGACAAGTPLICPEDDNPCTAAVCDPVVGCVQAPVPDTTPCNGTGGCVAGQCVTCGRNEELCDGRCRSKASYNGDDRNCGACGHVCPDSHICKGGFCRPLK